MSIFQPSSAVRGQAPGERKDWRRNAYCSNHDPELWFGTGDSSPGQDLHRWELDAKRCCVHHCPVLVECRAWALRSGQQFGVSGGMAAQERRAIRRAPEPNLDEEVEDERTRTVRQLAATGMSDPEIGAVIDRSTKTVQDIRRRAKIPPGRNRRVS